MKYYKNQETKRILFIITFAVILTAGVFNFDVILNVIRQILSILYPFIVGGVIAFILNVILRQLELKVFKKVSFEIKGRSFKRPICLFLTILITISIVFMLLFLLVPKLIEAILAMASQLGVFIPQAQDYLKNLFDDNPQIIQFVESLNIDFDSMLKQLTDFLTNSATGMLSNAVNMVTSFAGTLFSFMISFIFALYLLIQKENLSRQLRLIMKACLSEKNASKMEYVLALSFETFSSFVGGQGLEAIVLGCIVGGACWIFKLSYASLVGVIAALCSFIPMFGSMIALVIGTLLQLIVSPYQAIFFLVMMLIIQQIDGNLIYPNIMGNRIGLAPMWVLIAFTVGGSLMGLFGMLLFIPITSILYDLFAEWTYSRIKAKEEKKNIEDKTAVE